MAAAFALHRCDTRDAAQIYAAWRNGSRAVRERILSETDLFLKTQRQAPAAGRQSAAIGQELETVVAILRRASRRLADAAGEMNDEQRKQALRRIESARRELDRIAGQMGGDDAEPVAADHDTGAESQRHIDTRDRACDEAVAF